MPERGRAKESSRRDLRSADDIASTPEYEALLASLSDLIRAAKSPT